MLLIAVALSFLSRRFLNSSVDFSCNICFISIGLVVDIAYFESFVAEIRLDSFYCKHCKTSEDGAEYMSEILYYYYKECLEEINMK